MLFCLLLGCRVSAQTIPPDSIVLKAIYGKVNPDLKSATSTYESKPFQFNVAFKQLWKTNDSGVLLVVVTKALYGERVGHTWYLTTLSYLKQSGAGWVKVLSKTTETYMEGPYTLQTIGPGKMALVWESRLKVLNAIERSLSVELLTSSGAVNVAFIGTGYDNREFVVKDQKPDEPCKILYVDDTYSFVNEGGDYYTIKLIEKFDKYSTGCKSKTTEVKKLVYTFNGEKYEMMK